jgi:putative molybdopterin biosynthesis protein
MSTFSESAGAGLRELRDAPMTTPPQRHIYLKMKDLETARREFLAAFSPVSAATELVPIEAACDRVTATALWARASSPAWHLAAMDGVALMAERSFGARPGKPVTLVRDVDYWPANTGQVLPRTANAVVMIEHVFLTEPDSQGRERISLEEPAYPWQHVRKLGEDVVESELVLPAGTRIQPHHTGALVAAGFYEVPVRKRPRVAIIPTGSELVTIEEARKGSPKPGQVVEFNALVLAGLVRQAGGEATTLPPCPDGLAAVKQAIADAVLAGFDVIVVNAGSSAGSADHTANAIAELGQVFVHGIAIMPGKPTVLGQVGKTPVVGNPGYPVSAIISFEELVAPLLTLLGCAPLAPRPTVKVTPVAPLPSKPGFEEFVRVKLGKVGGRIVAVPLHRGAGSITSLTRADGLIRIPARLEGLEADREVDAELMRPLSEIEGALVVIGSHDPLIDVMNDLLHRHNTSLSISSAHVGSLGGLKALAKGQAHLAGSHLLDSATGVYNVSQIQQILKGRAIKVVRLVERTQGLVVVAGNPKSIRSLQDLARPDVVFINRQAGSGTRVLLDFELKRLGLGSDKVGGYDQEEYTHTAVAAAVLSGRADAGLGVMSAAKALSLDFVPIAQEHYELVIPAEHFDDARLRALLDVIRSPSFRAAAEALGGYGLERSGEVVWEQ